MDKKAKILVTFDDGIHNQYHAVKYLNERNIPCVIGAVANKISTPGFMELDMLTEFQKSGNMIINHSFNHEMVDSFPDIYCLS